ncbi:type IV secretion protein Rhs [Dyella lipolytica]|nr:type IV secretion protein Rhs [Dyella lipolytica]
MALRRFYNGVAPSVPTAIGPRWRQSFDRSLEITGSPATSIVVARPDGFQETFTKTNGVWTSDPDINDNLTETDNSSGVATSYTVFIAGLRHYETYSASGVLQTVTDETGQGITLTYSTVSTPSSVAPSAGLLLTVVDPKGRQLNFSYNANGNISQVTLPDGGKLKYAYNSDASGSTMLSSVQYPDGTSRQYVYNESSLTGGASLPSILTGIIDETGTRYESTSYSSTGQATSSYLAGNVNTTQVTYNSDGSASVAYPLGLTSKMTFSTVQGVNKAASLSQPCGPQCDQPWASVTYDGNGNPQTSVDFNGNTTATTYDSVGLLTQQIDAQGTNSQRTTAINWNTTLRVPLTRAISDANGNLDSSTQWVYNAAGQTLAHCDIDPTNSAATGYTCSNIGTVPAGVRRWTYTYCTAVNGTNCPLVGLLLTTTGPRADLVQTTSYSYYMTSSATGCGTPGDACYQAGDLHTVTDPLGRVTTIASYDADGRVTRITDPNGVNTDMTYTPRGWLSTRTVGGAKTTFGYMPYGAVQTIIDPDGFTTTFGYDAAHRLNKITDALGNYIQYGLDAAGDKTGEQIYDANGTLHKSLSRTFNTLGQLTKVVDGLSQTVFTANYSDSYDANGNLVHTADAMGIQQHRGYDALNRLTQTIDDYEGTDGLTPNTTVSQTHDSLDRVTQVTDPSNLNTTYQFDGLSDAKDQTSPDTGTTSRTFDAAGDVLTSTDAKGIVATNTYDALDRLISTTYPDTTQNVTYSYDDNNVITGCLGTYPIGHLTRIIENTITTVFCYDPRGNVVTKKLTTSAGTVGTTFTYTAADRLSGITYPSGSQVSYTFDGDGRVRTINLTPNAGSAAAAVSSVTYEPFGPVLSYTLGNGQTVTRSYDANYRLTDIASNAFSLHVARDAMGNIKALGNAPGANPATETYMYDPLYRLNTVTEASGTVLEALTYNPTGDRLSKTGDGLATGAYTYNPGTHQLTATGNAARAVDADGNTTSIAQASETYGFGYSARNRMTVAQAGGTTVGTYTYNGLGQRIGKGTTGLLFDYDQANHLISEYVIDKYGSQTREYVWLNDIPVADVDGIVDPALGGHCGLLGPCTTDATSSVNYIYADQLGTPRAVENSSGTVIWQWAYQGNPFGELAPTSSVGYTLNLRYLGQYFDVETGLVYNGYRNYDPTTGRYIESDPIGLSGGANTYAYVDGDPVGHTDPLGLSPPGRPPPMGPFLPPPDLLPPGAEWVPPLPNIFGRNTANQAQCMTKYQDDLESNADIMGDALNDCANSVPAQDDPNGLVTCRLEVAAMWEAADYTARKRRDACMKLCK